MVTGSVKKFFLQGLYMPNMNTINITGDMVQVKVFVTDGRMDKQMDK